MAPPGGGFRLRARGAVGGRHRHGAAGVQQDHKSRPASEGRLQEDLAPRTWRGLSSSSHWLMCAVALYLLKLPFSVHCQ